MENLPCFVFASKSVIIVACWKVLKKMNHFIKCDV